MTVRHCEERKRRSNPVVSAERFLDCFAYARNDGAMVPRRLAKRPMGFAMDQPILRDQRIYGINGSRELPSNPDIIHGGTIAALMAGIEDAARLDQQQLDIGFRIGLVFDALWDDEHFARRDVDGTIAKIDP
jgi:hypothetical protein